MPPLAVAMLALMAPAAGQQRAADAPTARLLPAPVLSFPSHADSNSPAVWERVGGQLRLFLFTSFSGQASRHWGADLARLNPLGPLRFEEHPGHGVWFESVIADADGTWYAYYHQERPADVCDEVERTIPRIGAARSTDFGATWEDLGVVLEAPQNSHDCGSDNRYFVGGVGDFSVVLDQDHRYLYFFFSQYARREMVQGVAVARLPWADRDEPEGRASVWFRNRTWFPVRTIRWADEEARYVYPAGTPIYPVSDGWHDGTRVDAFWGPSVHWNTHLEQYVMLLNHASDSSWTQEGIYVAFSPALDEPSRWSAPQRLLAGGRWYPQVLGLEAGIGTDGRAGERARFFMAGRSEYFIQFSK